MDKQQIEKWVSDAGMVVDGDYVFTPSETDMDVHLTNLERFAALVAAHEREQCALEADRQMEDEPYGHAAFRCANIAHEIRARSSK